jgi:hypothetical protein
MSTVQSLYGSLVSISITLASLANLAGRQSDAIDNSTDLFVDAQLLVKIKLAAGTPTGDKKVDVYAYGSLDGTTFTDNATGLDGAVTPRTPTNLQYLGAIECPDAGALAYPGFFGSVAMAFNGILPRHWGIVLVNRTGVAFDTAGHIVQYRGIGASNT